MPERVLGSMWTSKILLLNNILFINDDKAANEARMYASNRNNVKKNRYLQIKERYIAYVKKRFKSKSSMRMRRAIKWAQCRHIICM
jgi:hypothetical protein